MKGYKLFKSGLGAFFGGFSEFFLKNPWQIEEIFQRGGGFDHQNPPEYAPCKLQQKFLY